MPAEWPWDPALSRCAIVYRSVIRHGNDVLGQYLGRGILSVYREVIAVCPHIPELLAVPGGFGLDPPYMAARPPVCTGIPSTAEPCSGV